MNTFRTLLLTAAVLTHPTLALADKVFVERATGPGIADADLASYTELVRTSASQQGQELADSAKEAELTLRPKLMRLGAAYIATLERVEKGRVVRSDQLKAAKIEELDQVAQRLTRAVLNGEGAKADVRVGEVTDQEAHDGMNRKPARNGYLVEFGPASLSNLNTTGVAYSFTVAYAWDVNHAMIRLGVDSAFCNSAYLGDVHLGGNVFLTDRDVAPYIGAKAGLGLSKTNEGSVFSGETRGGFLVGAEAGVQFLRTSSINLSVGADWAILLNSNSFGNPMLIGGHLGIYF